MNRSSQIYVVVLLSTLVWTSCKKATTTEQQQGSEFSDGTIKVVARTSSLFEALPPWPISVKLLRAGMPGYDTLGTEVTNDAGECYFNGLTPGSYVGLALADDHYPSANYSTFVYLVDGVTSGTSKLYHAPRYHLGPDSLIFSVDTTVITDRVFSELLINEGLLDTLQCTFNTSLIPFWCQVTISTTLFRPRYFGTSAPNINISTQAQTFPRLSLPLDMQIPFSNQFENDTLFIRFVPSSAP